MRATLIAPRNESRIAGCDFFQSSHNVIAFCVGRIGLWTNHHKVVVHHRKTLDAKTFGHKLFFGRLVVNKHHIGIASAGHVQRLPCAQRHDFGVNACGLFKLWQQEPKQTRLLSRSGGRHHNGLSHGVCRHASHEQT